MIGNGVSMTSTHKILKNYLWTLVNQLLNMLFPLVTYGYAARILLADNLGQIAYGQSIVAYFAVVSSFGLGFYGTREIAKTYNSSFERSRVFWSLFSLKLFMGALSIAAYALIVLRLDSLDRRLSIILGIAILSAVFNSDWYFQGIEEFKWLTFRNFFVKTIGMSLTLLLVRNTNDLRIFASIIVLSELLLNIFMFIRVARLNSIKKTFLKPFRHFFPASFYLGSSLFITISAQIQKTLIGTFIALSDVGYYLAAEKVFHAGLVLVTSLGPAAMARISAEESTDKSASDIIASKTFLWQSFIASALSGLLIVASKDLTVLLFGNAFARASTLLVFISIGLIPKAVVNWVAMNILVPKGNEKAFFWLFVLNAVLSVVTAYILMLFFGVLGVAISTAITEIVLLIVVLIVSRQQRVLSRVIGAFRYYLALAVSLSVTFALSMLSSVFFSLPILPRLLLKVVVFGFIFLLVLWLAKDTILMILANVFRKATKRRK